MLKIKFVDFWGGKNQFREKMLEILNKRFSNVVECDDPDYVFFSVFGHEHLKYDCVRIMFLGENLCPDFNICDYAIGFHYIDFEDRYLRFPLYFFYHSDYELAVRKHQISDEELLGKQRFCNFVYSNGSAMPERQNFFELLSKYKQVDSGGRYLNNVGGPVKDKLAFQQQYRFSIAFENSSTNGYTTEKILQAFAAGTIPIYFGDPQVGLEFNEQAFINCHRYNSFEDVVEEVKRIDADEQLFRKYMHQPIFSEIGHDPYEVLENFIVHIFSQEPGTAIRRNNILCGKGYQREQKILIYVRKITNQISKLKTIIKKILMLKR